MSNSTINNVDFAYLPVHETRGRSNASVIPLSRWGKAQPSTASAVVLTKAQIAFVALLREAQVERSAFVTVHKVPQEVILYSGPFVAQGALHIVRERTLGQALDAIQDQFLALTNPSLLCLTLDGLALREMLVLCVNLRRIMAVQVRE